MNLLTDELIKKPPFLYEKSAKEPEGDFCRALKEELCFHYENNVAYRDFCIKKGFDPRSFQGDLADIPPVQVSVFKALGSKLNSVPGENIKLTLQSSATSGIPSSIPVDGITSKRQAKAMVRVVGDFIGNERKPFLIMDVDPMSGFREILGARYAAVSGYLNFASKVGYFLKVDGSNSYFFDIDGIRTYVNSLGNESAVVFGFTYILYSEVLLPLNKRGISFQLPQGSKIIHIGGWKKLESQKVDKETFNSLAASVFGITPSDVIDIYGFTEQMGLNYPDCLCGCKHAPLYSEVIIRDIATKKPLQHGEEGLLEFVSPLPHSYPGNVVLTDDIGMTVSGECPYHRQGTRFKVLGRLKKAEIRGCGDILSSKLKFAGHSTDTNTEKRVAYREYYCGKSLQENHSTERSIEDLGEKLQANLPWIREQPVDALIGLISNVSYKWKELSTAFDQSQKQGLQFLTAWCSPEHLNQIASEGFRNNRGYADGFAPVEGSGVEYIRATSRGLVCHWLAGNVQVLGMFVLIQSIISKNVNLLRVSSRDNGAFERLLSAFEGESFTTPGGYTISGDDLLKTIAIVYYDHADRKAGEKMSVIADARIAWGGSEAVSAVSAYPSKYDCVDIIMGPKLSFSVVSKEALDDERKAKKLARRVSVDASVFDQTGCASTHNVFVEKGGTVSPLEFAGYLADSMRKTAQQIPKNAMSPEELAAIHSARGVYDFKGTVFGDSDSIWTVLYSEETELSNPVYSRVVFVHQVDTLDDVLKFVNGDIQTIGLAAEGEKAMRFASAAAERGAVRFPTCGKMLNFESPWDGMFIMDRLVKWITLGGPTV